MTSARAAASAALALLAVLGPLAAAASAGDPCESCHGTSGGYAFRPLSVRATTARMVAPGTNFTHSVELRGPGLYTAKDVLVAVDLGGAPDLALLGPATVSLPDLRGGAMTAAFALVANATDADQVIATSVSYTAWEHDSSAAYAGSVSITVTIGETLLEPSTWRVELEPGAVEGLTFVASRALRNVTLLASPVLDRVAAVSGSGPAELPAGHGFAVSLAGLGPGEGEITVVYEDAFGTPHALPVGVAVAPEVPRVAPRGEGSRWFGAAFGFASLGLLAASAVIGMPFKPLKRRVTRAFASGAVRSSFHCGVSWVLIALALLHAAVLMYTDWSSSMLNGIFLLAQPGANLGTTINLGTIGWTAMLFTGAGGVLARPITRWIGHSGWRYTHSAMTLTALLASAFHSTVFTVRLV